MPERLELPRQRRGVALSLSGGGFRAALFHLGGLRRLNELGILSQLDVISSVSGGSIIAAHLADRIRSWPPPGAVLADWEGCVAVPFRAFTRRNLRTGPLLQRVLPWNWLSPSSATEALAERYRRRLTRLTLPELPDHPRFVFCATELAFGVNWVFEKHRVGSYQSGYLRPGPEWHLAWAVAASSCCPPFFAPLPVNRQRGNLVGGAAARQKRETAVLRLTDGGVYDNMALEPAWKAHRIVLVSDGGATFDGQPDGNLLLRLLHYASIVDHQVRALRRRRLVSGYKTGTIGGTYWGIGGIVKEGPGYPERLVAEAIRAIRTDMDAFSEIETAVLENHGYLLAEAAIRRHAPELVQIQAPVTVPHPSCLDEARVREALRDSGKRRLLGRW